MKKMWNQIGRPRPPAVDEIKIFDNDDNAAKHSERKRTFYGLVIIIKNFNFINSGGLGCPIWFHIFIILAFLVLGHYYFLHHGCFGWDFTSFFSSISFESSWLNSFDHTSCVCCHFQTMQACLASAHLAFVQVVGMHVCVCVHMHVCVCVCVWVYVCVLSQTFLNYSELPLLQ